MTFLFCQAPTIPITRGGDPFYPQTSASEPCLWMPPIRRAKAPEIRYPKPVELTRSIHNLALIGFMGTGKSSVGWAVAETLHFAFVDTDQLIIERTGKTITDIFTQEGEQGFRAWESQILAELALRRQTIISTGGGLPIQPGNLAALKSHSLVVCLWASPQTIYDRVKAHSHRPLLNDPAPLQRIRTLFAAREAYYRQADVLVNTELRSVREVAMQVVHHFQIAAGQ